MNEEIELKYNPYLDGFPLEFVNKPFAEIAKVLERRGAERMIKLLNEHSPFIESFGKITTCDCCMESKKIWELWENEAKE